MRKGLLLLSSKPEALGFTALGIGVVQTSDYGDEAAVSPPAVGGRAEIVLCSPEVPGDGRVQAIAKGGYFMRLPAIVGKDEVEPGDIVELVRVATGIKVHQ